MMAILDDSSLSIRPNSLCLEFFVASSGTLELAIERDCSAFRIKKKDKGHFVIGSVL